ncbi:MULTISPECIES: class I adenylate-forming enzyme family protein [unclassified Parafrankia]|uniref:class I adenylate-forming enzyme family protein n=1 Tax=unclassified Parafrankia TaxID=2994368 RepID=UPI000DA4CF2A|nr:MULTISPECIES: AMP-binding protein [unclassified Parafrankia]TCJ33770.1 AMP-dependent synthetase [Parafrankia sp. BMG5.11]SQD93543.1 AMP-dependent synthetase and ligase [Parafrankia sp. Ea1.12]
MNECPAADLADLAEGLAELRTRTVWQTLVASAERVPDHAALVAAADDGKVRRLTYSTLVERVRALSVGLASIGVRRGDRVVLWLTNTPEWIVSHFACMRLGAATVPVNTFLKPAEISYIITQSGARHVILLDGFRTLCMPAMLTEICPEAATVDRPGHLLSAKAPDLRNVVIFHRDGGHHDWAYDLTELETLGRDPKVAQARALADRMERQVLGSDLAMVKYTSGSTGFPKGVMLEQGGIVANAALHSRRVGIDGSDVFFSMMPFFHAGGSIYGLMTMLVNGGTLVFTEAFNAHLGAELIESERATVMFGVLPAEVVRAAIEDGRDLSSVRIAHVPNEDARRALPNVTFMFVPFGLTETYGPASMTAPDDPPDKRRTTGGRPLPGNEVRVVDPATGLDVPPGAVGEAWVRGNVMRGYWNKPEENARVLDADGWLHSEDLVSMDADGYITYAGRLKLMLKVGGENVSVEEVEKVVASHDAVAYCGVVGVPDRRRGEVVRAYVVVRPGHCLDADILHSWLKTRLARFKVPRDIVFLDELPRLANGKLDRVGLAGRAKEEVTA